MRYTLFKLNIRWISVCLAFLVCAAVVLASGHDAPAETVPCGTDAPGEVSGSDAAPDTEDESLGDVGGEFVSDCDVYRGELAVPAYISLERLVISQTVTKPLESARISSLFGYRLNPVSGKYSFHSGCDLAAPKGTEIHAMYSGKVVTAAYDNGYGNYLILDHGEFQTLYAHCSKLLCGCGDAVASGEVIALVGSTGNSTGPHLHVEFRRDGQRFDPEWILGGLYS